MNGAATSPLLEWLVRPRGDRTVRFAQDDGSWLRLTYRDLQQQVATTASVFSARRADTAETDARQATVIALPSGPAFVAAFFGSLSMGLTPTVIAPPGMFEDADSYVANVARMLAVVRPLAVYAAPASLPLMAKAQAEVGVDAALLTGAEPGDPEHPLSAERRCDSPLFQFTSGSTGAAKGVRLTWGNLEQATLNNAALVDYDPSLETATWLPFYHDMGLVGTLLTVVRHQGHLAVLRPEHFVLDPARWLRCFGQDGAAYTAAPPFAFAYAHRRVSDSALRDMDFSGWRAAIVGAERIDAGALARFAARCHDQGFRPSVYRPAYGLAEATLLASGLSHGEEAVAVNIDWAEIQMDGPVRVRAEASLVEAGRMERPGDWLIGCGSSTRATSVRIVDAQGTVLSDGYLGELEVSGPCVAAGYEPETTTSSTRFSSDGVLTGDAGFRHGGQLYVLGRVGDSISVLGKNVFVEDVEARLTDLPDLPKGRVTCFSTGVSLIVLAEVAPGPWGQAAVDLVRLMTSSAIPVVAVSAARGAILRTSSGKPQRRRLGAMHLTGQLAGQVIAQHTTGATALDTPPEVPNANLQREKP